MSFKFERLDVWKRAIDFANEMFEVAGKLPQREQCSIGEQLRRAGLSVPTNIAEGTGRDAKNRNISFGSQKVLFMKWLVCW